MWPITNKQTKKKELRNPQKRLRRTEEFDPSMKQGHA
jgi:hypothetical protein